MEALCMCMCACVLLLEGEAGISLLSKGSDTLCGALNLLKHPHRAHRYAAGDPGSSCMREVGLDTPSTRIVLATLVLSPRVILCLGTWGTCLFHIYLWLWDHLRSRVHYLILIITYTGIQQNITPLHPLFRTQWKEKEASASFWPIKISYEKSSFPYQKRVEILPTCAKHLSTWHWNMLWAFALFCLLWWSFSQCSQTCCFW